MGKETFNQRYFSQAEAERKVGKRVQTRDDFSGVPKGRIGLVISVNSAGLSKIGDTPQQTFDVAIQWDRLSQSQIEAILADLTNRLEQEDENENTIERFFERDKMLEEWDLLYCIDEEKPLVDWFTKEEYERYLDELLLPIENPGNVTSDSQ
jgi:hypothetical protein